ncbi:MAG: hypothetical protein GWO38_28030, partial [Phycisphaerae bacterium]|nr:hypothetical protein [Phycisphaerae bacterium]NIP55194.1 hypothetical protein [Phycisphaerae bacterium]NIX31369.1 hypothetical protein [Phycisphaerae bacterium]
FFNEYGSLQIVDRVDNMVIVGGENVYPTEIERVIPELEAMKEGIVLSLPDHIMGRELIFVYRGDVTDSKVKEWRNHLLTKLTNFKVPRRFVNVAELGFAEFPKAANGKVQRAKLQRRLEEVFGAAGGKAETKRDNAGDFVTEKTTSVFKEIMQIDEVRPDQCMENTPSWDSVNHLQLVMTLEQKFGVTFGAAQIAEITSLDSIIREVSKLRSGQRSQS